MLRLHKYFWADSMHMEIHIDGIHIQTNATRFVLNFTIECIARKINGLSRIAIYEKNPQRLVQTLDLRAKLDVNYNYASPRKILKITRNRFLIKWISTSDSNKNSRIFRLCCCHSNWHNKDQSNQTIGSWTFFRRCGKLLKESSIKTRGETQGFCESSFFSKVCPP